MSESDFDRLGAQEFERLVVTNQIDTQRRLLLAISLLLEQPRHHSFEVERWAGRLLDVTRSAWDAHDLVIAPDVLELYYEISCAVAPLRPGPRLDATFDAHTLLMGARFSRKAIADYDDAIAFIEVVRRYEPRALRVWGYPGRWTRGLERIVTETRRSIAAGEQLLGQRKRTPGWGRRARELSAELLRWRRILKRLRSNATELEAQAHHAESRLRRTEHELESWLLELGGRRPSDDSYDVYLLRGGWREESVSSETEIDRIERVLSPLAPDGKA